MEDYLEYMKTLRSHINDVEDQAVKVTVEEQKLITTVATLSRDLDSAKSVRKQLEVDTDKLSKAKGDICTQILDKQKKIGALEYDLSTLSQTLELIQQERISLAGKIVEKSHYYKEVSEDMNTKLQEQQEWFIAHKNSSTDGQHGLVMVSIDEATGQTENVSGECVVESHLVKDNLDNVSKNLLATLDAAKDKLDSLTEMKSNLVLENSQMKQSIEQLKKSMNDFKPEPREMNRRTLEEELEALLSDKAGENEYLQSLRHRIEELKGISRTVKCSCGSEYKIELEVSM